jgi:translation initiation factor IF-1
MAELGRIHPGDIVQVNVKGREAYALAGDRDGRRLHIEPITPNFTFLVVNGGQIKAHWRRTKNTSRVRIRQDD